MNVVSLFSGVGGFDLGFEQAGFRTVYQCEWDKHATRILERHWPDVPKWGDVQTLTGAEILRHCSTPDVIIWGSPCQDLSVAGKRAGLSGERSGLFHEGIRIINELREATDGRYPRISVWENVAGALNSNRGADFGTVLDQMAEAGAVVIEWALLDAQHFGVPQRRRRVFVVAIFDPATASRCPDPLLPVGESLRGDSAKGNKARKEVASTLGGGSGSRGWAPDTDTAETLTQRDYKDGRALAIGSGAEVANTIPASLYHHGTVVNQDVNNHHLILEPFVKSRRAQTSTDDETWVEGEVNPTLNSFDVGETRTTTAVVGSLQARDHKGTNHEGNGMAVLAPTITASNDPSRSPQSSEITQQVKAVHAATMAVRRLTPLECERLMGWPDNWTDGQADSHRYRQCGNGVATPVAKWIANHIKPTMEDN